MRAKDDEKDEGFLARWSRRKTEVLRDGEAAETAPPVETGSEETVATDEALTDAEALKKFNLPDPDNMAEGDDFSAFMQSGVPARLRNRALRKLWLTNPALANLDELLDYGEDFTDAATVVENLQTAYEVGRGFSVPEDEDEDADAPDAGEPEAREKPEAREDGAKTADAETPELEKAAAEDGADPAVGPEEPTSNPAPVAAAPSPEPGASRRRPRMAFTFE